MKTMIVVSVFSLASQFFNPQMATAQKREIEQLLLDLQKLSSLKAILNDMYKGYQVISTGYESIKNTAESSYNLHETFLNGLLQINPVVTNYNRIPDIINCQLMVVKEYKIAYSQFEQDRIFAPEEIEYFAKVYSNVLNESLKCLNELMMIITANTVRMNDDERLYSIDEIYNRMTDIYEFLRYFTNSISIVEVQRTKELNDATIFDELYGIK